MTTDPIDLGKLITEAILAEKHPASRLGLAVTVCMFAVANAKIISDQNPKMPEDFREIVEIMCNSRRKIEKIQKKIQNKLQKEATKLEKQMKNT